MNGTPRLAMVKAMTSTAEHVQDSLENLKLRYQAVKPSKFRRIRTGLGGSADAHYAWGLDYWRLREFARDMDRNDAFVGQLLDRAVANIIGTGLRPDPRTGDRGLDQAIIERWDDWASDPAQCDATGRHPFFVMEGLVLRSCFLDGDHFALPLDNGSIQLVEGDRVDSPTSTNTNVIHGVLLDRIGAPFAYNFIPYKPGERNLLGRRSARGGVILPARDPRGRPRVLHVYAPTRTTQTRGITVFHAVLDRLGMIEDTDFAKLVQAQIVSCFAAFITQESDVRLGARHQESRIDGTFRTDEGVTPGMIGRLRPGENIQSINANIPNPEYFPHIRHLLRTVGIQLGMPLELTVLDTSDTTFHGYRGALQQARKGFRSIMKWLPLRFHRPIYIDQVERWFPSEYSRMPEEMKRVKWRGDGFPYVDPLNDAKADEVRLLNRLAAPRHVVAERGHDWDEIVVATVEDYGSLIEAAIIEAKRLSDTYDVPVHWREVAQLNAPKGAPTSQFLLGPSGEQVEPPGPGGGPPPSGDEDDDDDDESEEEVEDEVDD